MDTEDTSMDSGRMDAESIDPESLDSESMDSGSRKPFKIKDVTRNIKKAVVAASLEEMRVKAAEKFDKVDSLPTIHFDCDGTEVDDEEYFRTLEPNAELIAVFPGQRWLDLENKKTHYVTISSRRNTSDTTDSTDAANVEIQKLVGQLKNNLCNVSVVSGPDLDSLSNMDPNSLVDLTGRDYVENIKDSSGRLGEEDEEEGEEMKCGTSSTSPNQEKDEEVEEMKCGTSSTSPNQEIEEGEEMKYETSSTSLHQEKEEEGEEMKCDTSSTSPHEEKEEEVEEMKYETSSTSLHQEKEEEEEEMKCETSSDSRLRKKRKAVDPVELLRAVMGSEGKTEDTLPPASKRFDHEGRGEDV